MICGRTSCVAYSQQSDINRYRDHPLWALVNDFVAECAFPNGADDEQVHAMTQARLRFGLSPLR